MAWAGFGKTQIRYDMFNATRSAASAKRYTKCENIYHKGQELAWDGKDILNDLLKEHGGIKLDDTKKNALKRVFAIIMWGELAAWKISAQLADGLVPLEAKMAATSQAFDEARHFYVMHDYLDALGYKPKKMDRAPQALLDLTLETPNMAYKLLGMQLMIESMALTIFQTIRELAPEPVIAELMKYYERDEARHVGLGMQYLPELIKEMDEKEVRQMMWFQAKIMFWAMAELKVLEPDFKVLGINPRDVIQLGRGKQILAMQAAFDVLGKGFDKEQRSNVLAALNAVNEFLYPTPETEGSILKQVQAAWAAFNEEAGAASEDSLDIHSAHQIKTARGEIAKVEKAEIN